MSLQYWDMKKTKWDYISYFICRWDKRPNKNQPKEEIVYFGLHGYMSNQAGQSGECWDSASFSFLYSSGGQIRKC